MTDPELFGIRLAWKRAFKCLGGILVSVKSQEWLGGSNPRCEFQEPQLQVLPTERFEFSVPIQHQRCEAGCCWKSRWSSLGLKLDNPKTLAGQQSWDLTPSWILDPAPSSPPGDSQGSLWFPTQISLTF